MKLTFVTGNAGKLMEAQDVLGRYGHEVAGAALAFDEPRSNDLEQIARAKLRQAARVLPPPFFVQDSGFYIEALHGFPGSYVNFALCTVGIDGLLALMRGQSDRRCGFQQCVGYFDGARETFFFSGTRGTLAEAARGGDRPEQLSPLWRIFIPEGAACALSEFDEIKLRALRGGDGRALCQLARFLQGEEQT